MNRTDGIGKTTQVRPLPSAIVHRRQGRDMYQSIDRQGGVVVR